MLQFENKTVMVTAGASGIGSYIAASFAQQGARVHIVDIDENALLQISTQHPTYEVTQADVSDIDHVDQLFKKHLEFFGGIDVMVNCAGIAGPTAMVEEIGLDQWQKCLSVNLDATFLCSQRSIPFMKQQRSGHIINLSSTAGWHGYPLRSPYSAAKWAVIGLTKSLAMELGQYGITANVICPGSVDGKRMDQVIAAEAIKKGIAEEEIRKDYTRSCSLRTFISGQDIADMALFLASEKATKVTGQVMNVDGHLEYTGGMDDLNL